jgi:hypothetical protein
MKLRSGDRVMVRTVDDDGWPMVRYGNVCEQSVDDGPIVVVYDELSGADIVDASEVRLVDMTSVELVLHGFDLSADPELRQGLAAMWRAEADVAGVVVLNMYPLGAGLRDSSDTWALAEVSDATDTYVVRVHTNPNTPDTVIVRADRPNRWDW